MRYAVITEVPSDGDYANLAMGPVYLDPQAEGGSYTDPYKDIGTALGNPLLNLYVRVPVFRKGELLLIDHNDRDQFGRKPSKWTVTCQEFDTLEEAAVAVLECTAEPAGDVP